MRFEEISLCDIDELVGMYIETFNTPPWNDEWTVDTASKRLKQFINSEDSYGIKAYVDEELCGMILGSEEQFFDGRTFHIKEFCVNNNIRNRGIGTRIFKEFEKRLKNKNIQEIILLTCRSDETESFYKKLGLKQDMNTIMMKNKI